MRPRRVQISWLVYWAAVAALFALAAWQRFSLPLDPIADPDVWGYLSPPLKELTGSGFFLAQERNFVYPAFLLFLLRLFGDFRAITITQHLLGLAAGGLLLMTWQRTRAFVKAPRMNAVSYDALGLVAAAIFLLAGEPIRAEMQIRPEGVCAFLLSLNLWLAIEFTARTFLEKRPMPVGLGIGLAMTVILLASVKPSFIFLAVVSLIPVGVSFLRPGFFSRKLWLAGGAATGALLLLLLPKYFPSIEDDLGRPFLPTTLFVVHADLIRDQMADDLRLSTRLPYPREWLSRVHADLSAEIAKSTAAEPEHYPSLGFCPDYLMHREDSIARRLGEEFHRDNAAIAAFYRFYYWRTWRQRPFAMAKKVARQLALFYAPICPAYDRSKTMSLAVWYQLGVATLNQSTNPEVWKAYPPGVEFMRRTESLAQRAAPIEQRKIVRIALNCVAGAYLLLLGSTLVLGFATLFHGDFRRRLGWLVALTLFVFLYNAAACLEVAIVNSLEVPRYSTVQMFVTLLAEFLAVCLLVESLFQNRIWWGRPIQTSAPGE
jgi:hypothetical protein